MNIHKHKSQSNNKTNNNNQLTPELSHHLIPSRNSRSLAQALPTKSKRWNSSSQKPAFTIIEVVLVLAIAGLIFLMVFIALPALQRNQRDTQRKNDIGRVLTAVQKYQANNRGNMPSI
ncbi:MAG: type II secretion system protein [Candidatus Nanogingivalis sp.]